MDITRFYYSQNCISGGSDSFIAVIYVVFCSLEKNVLKIENFLQFVELSQFLWFLKDFFSFIVFVLHAIR